ncbi:MAG: MFS transporter [Acholeplasmatales bacterium]|nr:MAG: MFS transporter [Acholeplasmatales bacterium]
MKRSAWFLLFVIYMAFIALGFPDALLGSSWNLVRIDLDVALGGLGLMTLTTYVMSTLTTFNAPRLLRVLSTKVIVFFGMLIIAVALIMISLVDHYYQILFFAIPLGLGGAAIDVSLNHYLAAHYKATHMNFLHSFYGVGVTLGPTVMAVALERGAWRLGYLWVGVILMVMAGLMLLSFPLWKEEAVDDRSDRHAPLSLKTMFKTPGARVSVAVFLTIVFLESLGGLWMASYMYETRGVDYVTAALFTSTFYFALTLGRFGSGFLAFKIRSEGLIVGGEVLILLAGILLFALNGGLIVSLISVALYGLGCAPVFPNLMFLNSERFEPKHLSKIMSLQMAIGYMGFGILTPLAGLWFDRISLHHFPVFVVLGAGVLLVLTHQFFQAAPAKRALAKSFKNDVT